MKEKIKELRKNLLKLTLGELKDNEILEELGLLRSEINDVFSMIKEEKKPFILKNV